MGWLYKTSLDGFAGPRQYLDADSGEVARLFRHDGARDSGMIVRTIPR